MSLIKVCIQILSRFLHCAFEIWRFRIPSKVFGAFLYGRTFQYYVVLGTRISHLKNNIVDIIFNFDDPKILDMTLYGLFIEKTQNQNANKVKRMSFVKI